MPQSEWTRMKCMDKSQELSQTLGTYFDYAFLFIYEHELNLGNLPNVAYT